MLQQKNPDNFVISSGKTCTVKEFVNRAARYMGFDLAWSGKGLKESAIDRNSKKTIITIDKNF